MTNTEQLVEAVVYAADDGIEWYEVFDSKTDALKILRAASREIAEEEQIICLIDALDCDDLFEESTIQGTYRNALRSLKNSLDI